MPALRKLLLVKIMNGEWSRGSMPTGGGSFHLSLIFQPEWLAFLRLEHVHEGEVDKFSVCQGLNDSSGKILCPRR